MNDYVKRGGALLAAIALMLGVAGAGAYAAGGLKIGGRALVDIVPTEEIKAAASMTFRHQTVDLLSKYAVQVADQAIHLEFSTYDHLAVVYNMVVSMPDGCELIALEGDRDRLILTGLGQSRAAAEQFEENLTRRGFAVPVADYAANMAGECVFYFELPVAEANLRIP